MSKRTNTRGKPTPKRAKTARAETKKDKILTLLKRPKGATVLDLMKATGWQSHSVRGFLSGTIKKKLGLKLDSWKGKDGLRNYRIGKSQNAEG